MEEKEDEQEWMEEKEGVAWRRRASGDCAPNWCAGRLRLRYRRRSRTLDLGHPASRRRSRTLRSSVRQSRQSAAPPGLLCRLRRGRGGRKTGGRASAGARSCESLGGGSSLGVAPGARGRGGGSGSDGPCCGYPGISRRATFFRSS